MSLYLCINVTVLQLDFWKLGTEGICEKWFLLLNEKILPNNWMEINLISLVVSSGWDGPAFCFHCLEYLCEAGVAVKFRLSRLRREAQNEDSGLQLIVTKYNLLFFQCVRFVIHIYPWFLSSLPSFLWVEAALVCNSGCSSDLLCPWLHRKVKLMLIQ